MFTMTMKLLILLNNSMTDTNIFILVIVALQNIKMHLGYCQGWATNLCRKSVPLFMYFYIHFYSVIK